MLIMYGTWAICTASVILVVVLMIIRSMCLAFACRTASIAAVIAVGNVLLSGRYQAALLRLGILPLTLVLPLVVANTVVLVAPAAVAAVESTTTPTTTGVVVPAIVIELAKITLIVACLES